MQPGGVPLWIGGALHARNLDRLVRWGDAWIPIMGATLDDIADGARRIADAWRAAGRDPDVLQVQAPLRIERGDDGVPTWRGAWRRCPSSSPRARPTCT